MLSNRTSTRPIRHCGFSMIEVLVTIVILAFGLLGLAGLQMRVQNSEMESYQRAQALVLLNSMVERINANRANAAAYVSATPLGTGDTQPSACTAVAMGVARDQCEWSNALKGSAETSGTGNVGAMVGARGCITQIQAANPAAGICTPGVYEIAVAWQGLTGTVVPAKTCAQGLYGVDDSQRRVISAQITVGLPSCL